MPAITEASPDAPPEAPPASFAWRRSWVDDRPALYGVAEPTGLGELSSEGTPLPAVFLHGWALGYRAYRQSIDRLVALGCRVYAPALPGFGGTPDLPRRHFSLTGYADWVDGFLDSLGIEEEVFLLGHSFGGGVAIKTAHRYPERVRTLVLINSIGGSSWQSGATVKAISERPLWDWGLHFPSDVWPLNQATKVLPVVLADALPNLVRNPRALWKVGTIARNADLTHELAELRDRQLPVVVLWGARDGVVPRAAFDAMCTALESEGEVVEGSHSWLLADPDHFGEVMTNHVEVARLARELEAKQGRWSRNHPVFRWLRR
jgi:pimeloyl-ACP methyl ester carboxylesterase